MYNIEVDGDHVYRVGEQGLLVHNASAPCDIGGLCGCDYFGPNFNPPNGKQYLALDGMGRATGIKARLCKSNANEEGSPVPSGFIVAGWMEGLGGVIARAHLLGQNIGGPGDVRRNLVVTCRTTNNNMFTLVERQVRRWLDNGLVVDYQVEPVYQGLSPYPAEIKMRARALDLNATMRSGSPGGGGRRIETILDTPNRTKM